ncbi:MAG: ABC transporter ATP-binding protein [Phycisphaeraceae bacterium]|nr:ABC transporter ATP-binding protein [Phycisphaeraceae bacterium]
MPDELFIQATGLRKVFGSIRAVDGVDLAVRPGEVLGFLGPNGAGKSTTMRMITGFLEPTAGSVRICGIDLERDPLGAKQRIGYLPEGAPVYPDMTVREFLWFIARARRYRGAEAASRIDGVVRRLQLAGVLDQPVETLSKGFKRRVGLAQAILHDPPVLILDEPTDGLDPNQKHEVRTLIRDMAGRKAIVLSTHILEEVDAVCTRAVIIDRGRVVFDGTPADLDAKAPASVERNRLDHVFRSLTTGEGAGRGGRAGDAGTRATSGAGHA